MLSSNYNRVETSKACQQSRAQNCRCHHYGFWGDETFYPTGCYRRVITVNKGLVQKGRQAGHARSWHVVKLVRSDNLRLPLSLYHHLTFSKVTAKHESMTVGPFPGDLSKRARLHFHAPRGVEAELAIWEKVILPEKPPAKAILPDTRLFSRA